MLGYHGYSPLVSIALYQSISDAFKVDVDGLNAHGDEMMR